MKMTKETTVRVTIEMDQEAAECLVALLYCNLRSPDEGPLSELPLGLQAVLNISESEELDRLKEIYSQYVAQ